MAMPWRECASVCYVRTYNGLGCKECMYEDTDCPKLKETYEVESPYEIETLMLNKKNGGKEQ